MHHKICTLADILEPQQNAESLKPRKTAKFKLPMGKELLKIILLVLGVHIILLIL